MGKPQKAEQKKSDWKKIGPCLYRYKSGAYYALIKRNGKQIRRSLNTSDLALARRALKTFIEDSEAITDPDLGKATIETFAPKFFATLSGAPATIYKHRLAVRCMIENWPADAPRGMAKIRRGDCEAWVASLGELAPATINGRITTAARFFQLAVNSGAIAKNPMDGITYRRRSNPIRNTPTEEQFRAIIADLRRQKCNGHGADDSADFVELAGTLGLGQAELTGIRRQDIDLTAGVIKVFRRKTRQQFTIPIFPDARPIIERRLAAMGPDPEARLLPQDNCRKGLAGACRRLALPSFEPRSLRRFHITRCLRAGVDAPTVAAWQGHRDGGALILKTYQAAMTIDHSLLMAEKLKGAA
jgi:integrase